MDITAELKKRREKPRARHHRPSWERDDYVRYFNNAKYEDDDGRFIESERQKRTVASWYPADMDLNDIFSRPLAILWMRKVTIPTKMVGIPEWVYSVRNYINKAKTLKIRGGGLKDIVIPPGDGYVYTFYIPFKNFENTYVSNLRMFTEKMSNLDPQIQDRVNYPKTLDDICVYDFNTNRTNSQKLVMTRLKYCPNSDLNNYKISSKFSSMRIKKFAQITYELIKTLRVLHSVDIYLLDIKPGNIFVCFRNVDGDAREVFAYGDVDLAIDCQHLDCTGKIAGVYTPEFTTRMLLDLSKSESMKERKDRKRIFALRDIYALMKTLLVTFIKVNRPWAESKDIMVGALRNLIGKDAWYDAENNMNRVTPARVWPENIDQTVRFFTNVIESMAYGTWTTGEKGYVGGKKKDVMDALKKMLIGKKGILNLMIKASYGDLKAEEKDSLLKSIQSLAKNCGATPFKWEKQIENASDLFKRLRGMGRVEEEDELAEGMDLMSFEEMGRRGRGGGRRRKQGYRRNYNKREFTKGSCVPKIKF